MERIERERRALYIASLLLALGCGFGIEISTVSIGGISINLRSAGWIYVGLTWAWLWFAYRYWLVSNRGEHDARHFFREGIRNGIDRTPFQREAERRLRQKLSGEGGDAYGAESLNLVPDGMTMDGEQFLVGLRWDASWTRPPRRNGGAERVHVPLKAFARALWASRIRQAWRSDYLTEYCAPWAAFAVAGLFAAGALVRLAVTTFLLSVWAG